ncbi:DUF2586 family protein [Amniculibacterium sp. G2-70]|uniref:DUF2586 family protein n=1 Tax=Amniculibacterium sp. G2-70 TaxID=2767188 RepID=UPI00165403C9|nr:DUF2586 family protein [Amniculibacterium sp. G2-70]
MSDLSGIKIEKGRLGANRKSASYAISGLVISAIAASALALDTPTTVYNMNDVKMLGITEEYDATNNINVHRHISEFYRNAGEGTELHLMLVAQSVDMPTICDTNAKQLLAFAKGNIKQLAIAINLESDAVVVPLNGMPTEVYNAIPKAQGLYGWADSHFMPCQIILECYQHTGSAASSANLRDLENLEADKVTLVNGQDFLYASTKTGNAQKFADVGTVLGVMAKANVNQNIGNNEIFNITDATKGVWIEPGISSHKTNTELIEDLQTFENKGYVFGVAYTGMAGVRINNDHVCAPIIIDEDNKVNEHTIALGRTSDKARRELRTVYLPKVKTDWFLDETTGKLRPATIVALEDIGDKVFGDMMRNGEITYGKTTVDPESDLIVEKKLIVSYVIVPRGNIGEIKGTINFKTQI